MLPFHYDFWHVRIVAWISAQVLRVGEHHDVSFTRCFGTGCPTCALPNAMHDSTVALSPPETGSLQATTNVEQMESSQPNQSGTVAATTRSSWHVRGGPNLRCWLRHWCVGAFSLSPWYSRQPLQSVRFISSDLRPTKPSSANARSIDIIGRTWKFIRKPWNR
jgi:hypothetical protein